MTRKDVYQVEIRLGVELSVWCWYNLEYQRGKALT